MAKKIVTIQLNVEGKSAKVTLDSVDKSFKSIGKSIKTVGIGTFSRQMQQSSKILNASSVSIEQIDAALNELGKTYNTVSTNAARMKIASQIKDLEQLKGQLTQNAIGLDDFGKSGGDATNAVINFNRVIQDAPYGIIGVANNIDPLIQSFNQLKSTTGSTTGAIGTLLKSAFTGPGALITVFSLASTAAVIFAQRMRSSGSASSEAADEMEKFSVELKKASDFFKELTEQRIDDFVEGFTTSKEQAEAIEKAIKSINSETADLLNQQSGLQRVLQDNYKLNSDQRKVLGEQLTLVSGQLNTNDSINKLALDILQNMLAQLKAQGLIDEALKNSLSSVDLSLATYKEFNAAIEKTGDTLLWNVELLDYTKMTLDELMDVDYNVPEKIFPLGSLGAITEDLKGLQEQLQYATNPDIISNLNAQIEALKKQIADITDGADKTRIAWDKVGASLGGAIAQQILYTDSVKEATRGIIKAVVAEMVSRAMLAAFNPPTPASLFLAPVLAASATKLATSLIPGFAEGVTGYGGGMALVGERGPEIVTLPQGSNVVTNQNTESIISAISRSSLSRDVETIGAQSPDMVAAFREALESADLNIKGTLRNKDIRLAYDKDKKRINRGTIEIGN